MIYTVVYANNGQPLIVVDSPSAGLVIEYEYAGMVEVNYFPNIDNIYVDNGQVCEKPAKPSKYYVFDYDTKSWVDNRTDDQKFNDAANPILAQRSNLLYQCDWTQSPDSPLSAEKKAEWAVYRQQLRDITTQTGYPFNVIWPVQPE